MIRITEDPFVGLRSFSRFRDVINLGVFIKISNTGKCQRNKNVTLWYNL
jgi:hypothetical protein